MSSSKLVSVEEVSKHNTNSDCWIVVDGNVWDISSFAPEHPGGADIIYRYAGRDATAKYSEIHSPSIIKDGLDPSNLKGKVDPESVTEEWLKPPPSETVKPNNGPRPEKPDLYSIVNSQDFELAAQATATKKTWAFYSSAANDLVTRDLNRSLFSRVLFRPRVMRNVTTVETKSSILGNDVSCPILVSPAAMAKLIHPDGEMAIARACQEKNIVQCISTAASFSAKEIVTSITNPNHPFFFQLYVSKDRKQSEKLLSDLNKLSNLRAIFVTTDAAAAGKREADERVKADETIVGSMSGAKPTNDKKGGSYGRTMGAFIDPGLCWDDVKWLRRQTKLPLVLKGIMSADDVMMAAEHGLDGVLLSNHGGRNLDTSPPALITLLECHKRCPDIFSKLEVYVDGGIRRGSDILKAVCLGATAVGMGRSFLFATGYGQEGCEHLIDIMKDELEVAMANNGITSLSQAGPHLVNTGDIDHLVPGGKEHPYVKWNPSLTTRSFRAKL